MVPLSAWAIPLLFAYAVLRTLTPEPPKAGMRAGSASTALFMNSPARSTTFAGSHTDAASSQRPSIAGYFAGCGRSLHSWSSVVALAAVTARPTASSAASRVGIFVNAEPILLPR